MKYKITVFGNKTTTADLIRHLKDDGCDIGLIVTLSKEAEASKDISGADDIEHLAQSLAIPVYATKDYRLNSETDKKFFSDNMFDIGICTGWQRLLPKHVLAAFPIGIFGFHGSCWKFPHGRGRSPLNWSMRLGGSKIYHNCFKYIDAADAGEVFNTTEFAISPFDSIASVQFKALLDMKMVSSRLLRQYESGTIKTIPQPGGAAITLPKLAPLDGQIKFSAMSLTEILDLINATSKPFPGAFAILPATQDTLRIWRAIPFEFPEVPPAKPGEVLDTSLGQVLIACTGGLLLAVDYEFIPASGADLAPGLRFA